MRQYNRLKTQIVHSGLLKSTNAVGTELSEMNEVQLQWNVLWRSAITIKSAFKHVVI